MVTGHVIIVSGRYQSMLLCDKGLHNWVGGVGSLKLEKYEKIDDLLNAMDAAGIPMSASSKDRIEAHLALVMSHGATFGVVSIGDIERGAFQHVVDSLSMVPYIGKAAADGSLRYVDVGSGGGFPGIVCAACLPDVKTLLIERSEKKCAFLRRAAGELGLDNVDVVQKEFSEFEWEAERSVVSVRGLERVEEQLPVLLSRIGTGSCCFWLTGPKVTVDLGSGFHVEQIVDRWTAMGLRRGALFCIRVK